MSQQFTKRSVDRHMQRPMVGGEGAAVVFEERLDLRPVGGFEETMVDWSDSLRVHSE